MDIHNKQGVHDTSFSYVTDVQVPFERLHNIVVSKTGYSMPQSFDSTSITETGVHSTVIENSRGFLLSQPQIWEMNIFCW
jgi:hypothetical protein